VKCNSVLFDAVIWPILEAVLNDDMVTKLLFQK